MFRLLAFFVALASFVSAQQINFGFTTGTRSLWIPFKTANGVLRASVLGRSDNNQTTYVISCPTGDPGCAFAPNLTVTEGTDMVRYTSTTSGASSGTVAVSCLDLTTSPIKCSQYAHGNGNVQHTGGVISQSEIKYSAVDVTALKSQTPITGRTTATKTVTTTPSSTSTTSNGGLGTMTAAPFAMAGAVGAGILALAAL